MLPKGERSLGKEGKSKTHQLILRGFTYGAKERKDIVGVKGGFRDTGNFVCGREKDGFAYRRDQSLAYYPRKDASRSQRCF